MKDLKVDIQNRNFYHNFPRIRPGYDHEKILKDGLKILKSIQKIGLVLAPELVEWKQVLVDGNTRSTIVRQNRISFTELSSGEIGEHGEKFGPFSLEFEIETLRRLGALPVIYMPQMQRDLRSRVRFTFTGRMAGLEAVST